MLRQMTLTDFLLARIAEEEQRARHDAADAMTGYRWKGYPREAYEELQRIVIAHSRHVLAECEARRRIVDYREQVARESAATGVPIFEAQLSAYDAALRALAVPYADHPDYRDEWRP